MAGPARKVRRNRAAPLFSLFLSLLFAMAAYGYFRTDQRAWMPASMFAVQAAIAAVLRFGWTVPCFLAGVIFGLWLDPVVKGGSIESQVYESVTLLILGSFVGLSIGVGMDFARA